MATTCTQWDNQSSAGSAILKSKMHVSVQYAVRNIQIIHLLFNLIVGLPMRIQVIIATDFKWNYLLISSLHSTSIAQ